jgi:hypothetical protein
MSSPRTVLHPAVVSALNGSAALASAMGGAVRAYDRVPTGPTFPYLTVKVPDTTEDDDGCGLHWLCAVEVHVWSRATGSQEASEIVGPVRAALDAITTVTGYAINFIQFRQDRVFMEPDGLTTHGIVTAELHLSAT